MPGSGEERRTTSSLHGELCLDDRVFDGALDRLTRCEEDDVWTGSGENETVLLLREEDLEGS